MNGSVAYPQKGMVLLVKEYLKGEESLEQILYEWGYAVLVVSDLKEALLLAKQGSPFIVFVGLSLARDVEKIELIKQLGRLSLMGVAFVVDCFSEATYSLAREIKGGMFLFPPIEEGKVRSLITNLLPEFDKSLPSLRQKSMSGESEDVMPIAVWTQDFSVQKKFLEEIFPIDSKKSIHTFLLENRHILHACIALSRIVDADSRTLDFFSVSSVHELQSLFQSSFSSEGEIFNIALFEALLKGERFFEKDIFLTLPDGTSSASVLIRWSVPYGRTDYTNVHVVALDVSSIKQSVFELELQKKKFERIFQSSPAGIAILDPSLKAMEVNDAFVHMFGFSSKDEIMGKSVSDFIVPSKYMAQSLSICQMVLNGKKVFLETQRCRKDGQIIDVFLNSSPVTMPGGIVAICYLYTDISEKKRGETLLKRKLKVEQMVSEISAEILNYPSLENAIRSSLHKMALYIDADRVSYLVKRHGKISFSSEWRRRDIPPMKAFYDGDEDVFLLNSDSWFCANLDRGEAFSIENKIILPREAIHTLNFMKRHNVESLLVIPYRFRGEVNGFILFERIENYFNWSKDELSLFNLFAEMLSSLKDRDAAYEMLHQDREKYQRLFLQLQEPFMLFDVLYDKLGQLADVRFIEINEQARLFLEKKGYGDIVGRSLLDVFSVEDLVFKNAMKNVIETGELQTLSFNSMLLNCTMTLSYFVPQKGQLAILISHISESSEKGRKA